MLTFEIHAVCMLMSLCVVLMSLPFLCVAPVGLYINLHVRLRFLSTTSSRCMRTRVGMTRVSRVRWNTQSAHIILPLWCAAMM